MIKLNYTYKAFVTKVYDGDTITADIDLGFGILYKKVKLRLARINAPEVRGIERDKGILSRDYLRNLILHREVLIETKKDTKGKYGRYIAEIWLFNGVNINDFLVEQGLAIYKDY
jgi:micrococcal nuclease